MQKNVPFEDYITHSKQLIQSARVDLSPTTREAIIQANTPFEYQPFSYQCKNHQGRVKYKRGILLIHGLTASPFMMQELANFFRSRCFLARSILLPGHGTRPGNLVNIDYEDWIEAVNYGVQSFEGQVEEVFLAGYSIGGALAVHYALRNQTQLETEIPPIKALFLFSPALKAKSNLTFLAGSVSLFKDWMSIHSERDYAAYESFPYNAAAQSHQLIVAIDALMENKQNFPVPVFMALSEDDETVDSSHSIDVFRRQMNVGLNHMQLYSRKPQNYTSDPRIEALQSAIDSDNILSFSHTSMTVPRRHPHYGINGNYRRCLHYQEQSPDWMACTGSHDIAQAEVTKTFLEQRTILQLTYNPYFAEMLTAMGRFIDSIERAKEASNR